MKITYRRPVSLLNAHDGRRLRLAVFVQGTCLVPVGKPLRILGFWHRGEQLTAYVAGPMPAHLRTACEEGRTDEEQWFGPLPAGLQEIDLTECRYEYLVQLPGAQVLPLYPASPVLVPSQAA